MTWADIVYWAPLVAFVGVWIGGAIVFHEIWSLAHYRIVTAEEIAKLEALSIEVSEQVERLEEDAAFIAHSNTILNRVMTLFNMDCKEEAALELARLGEHARDDLEERGIL
jgi:hypothetical protein